MRLVRRSSRSAYRPQRNKHRARHGRLPQSLGHQRDTHALRHQLNHAEPVLQFILDLRVKTGIQAGLQNAILVVRRHDARRHSKRFAAQNFKRQ